MRGKSVFLMVVVTVVASIASAELIRGIDIDFVTIGNPGNPGDNRVEANPPGCGAVGYEYQIGKYEVTNAQWTNFITLSGGPPTGSPDHAYDDSPYFAGADVPTGNVSWYEAAQFCNYLTSGDKNLGAYLFSNGNFTGIDRPSAVAVYGAAYVIPTEDEWYKAAYYAASRYSTYANGTDTAPVAGIESNYGDVVYGPWDIGTGTMEQNGTYDMMGNGWEWNETFFLGHRGLRGGSSGHYDDTLMSSYRLQYSPAGELASIGFRVAAIPEPSSLLLLGLGGLILRRRQ